MSEQLKSDRVYFIINNKLNLAWDLAHHERRFVVGTPLKGEESQKVRYTANYDPSLSLSIV